MTDTINSNETDNKPLRDERGRMLRPLPGAAPAITSANARDMLRLREAKRHRLYAEGAQLAVQDMQLIERYGEDAHMVERARTLQEIATTPDAGKAAVMAAAQLDKAQGYDNKDTEQGNGNVTNNIVMLMIADAMRRGDIIEGQLHEGNAEEDESNDE